MVAEAVKPKAEVPPPEKWVDEYGDYLYRCAFVRLHDPELAADAVQETLLAALESIDRLENPAAMKSWLVGILKHKVIDHFRKRSRERPVSEVDSSDDPFDEFFDAAGEWKPGFPKDWGENPGAELEKSEFWSTFRECLAKLPGRLSQAFALRVLDDRSSEEVYKEMDITPTNLWVILYRARMHLRRCLEMNWFTGTDR